MTYTPSRTFQEMPIHSLLKATLDKKGYTYPTEIQDKSLEHILEGNDVLSIAKTGTGKTAAFLIPIIHQLLSRKRPNYALAVVPTRELAMQVEQEFKSMTKGLGLYSECFIGGTSVSKDMHRLRRPCHLIVGTPGRLIDLKNRGALDLRDIAVLVLDEYDRMLDMGFSQDVKQIAQSMFGRKQTMLFSATLDRTQQKLIDEMLNEPVEIKVSTGEASSDHIEQDIIRVREGENKFDLLYDLVTGQDFDKVLIFAETKRQVDQLCGKLVKSGIRADQIHGDKSQAARQKALDKFKTGRVDILVATDVAARGIDVSDVTHVINYHIPKNMDTYIHRIGRTGRAGKMGMALTFID